MQSYTMTRCGHSRRLSGLTEVRPVIETSVMSYTPDSAWQGQHLPCLQSKGAVLARRLALTPAGWACICSRGGTMPPGQEHHHFSEWEEGLLDQLQDEAAAQVARDSLQMVTRQQSLEVCPCDNMANN